MAEHSRNSIQEESAREAGKLRGVRGEGLALAWRAKEPGIVLPLHSGNR